MTIIWNPTKKFIRSTNIYLFQKFIESKLNKSFLKYNNLWKWSVKDKENFWDFLSIYFKVRILKKSKFKVYQKNKNFIQTKFFNNSSINYYNQIDKFHSKKIAIKFISEKNFIDHLTYDDMHNKVNALSLHFINLGIIMN